MGGWVRAPKKALGRLRECRVHFGTFDFAFYCVVGPAEDLPGYVAFRHGDTEPEWVLAGARGANGVYVLHGNKPPVVWLRAMPRSPRQIGTVAHEVLHIVRFMFEWVGMHLNDDTQEAYCHALQHGVTTILTELRR